MNRFEKARAAYGRCLEWARKNGKDAERALTLNNLGGLDRDQGPVEEARKEYEETLQIYEALAKQDSQRFSADVTRVEKLLAELPK